MKSYIKQKRIYQILSFALLIAAVIGCGVKFTGGDNILPLNAVGEEVSWVKAGDYAIFKLDGEAETNEEKPGFNLIMSVLVPKSWNAKENTIMTLTAPSMNLADAPMVLVPEGELPKGKNLSWANLLMNAFGVMSNVLNDMEWVTFKSTAKGAPSGKTAFTVTVKCKTGPKNLKAHIGFFVNHTDDGYSGEKDHYSIRTSACIEVREGDGPIIDFCDMHYNKVEPLAALQDDFVTFTFQGGTQTNKLVLEKEIYMEATAYTAEGHEYPVTQKNAKNLMTKEGKFGGTYSLTVWPAGYFGVPEGETITHIDYFFTNKDGTVVITKSDDEGDELEEGEEKEPFSYILQCE